MEHDVYNSGRPTCESLCDSCAPPSILQSEFPVADRITASVVISGAGPVGLTLAMDLAWRGIDVVVIEQRRALEPPSVKCNHVSSRSMEIFRRLGLADEIRAAGLPDDYPHDAVVRTRATGHEICRVPIPSRRARFTSSGGPDMDWPTPEPAHRINQIYLEPILFRRAAATTHIRILSRTQVDGHQQEQDHVLVRAHDLDAGMQTELECRYFIGCDGARSQVRRDMGATLSGDDVIQRVQSTYFRAPELIRLLTPPPGWMNYLYTLERAGNLIAIDGQELWLLHNYLLPTEKDFESVDRDRCLRHLLGVGPHFEYDLLTKEDWIGRRLVVNTFRKDRVFLCGDSAHLWVPYAGYGMNAGLADAANLAWILAAHLKGWAPEAILDAYDQERRPTTEQVSRFVANYAAGAILERTSVPSELEADTPEGAAARARIGRTAYAFHVQQFACAGLNFGYAYENSPLIAYDGEKAPPFGMRDYTPSTVPGARTPHLWLGHGRSLYDFLGRDYTLLRFDLSIDITPLTAAAARAGLPLKVLDLTNRDLPACHRHKLLLSRPDQHVAWRGNAVPADVRALVDLVRGAGPRLPD